jgi:hypothetical protein
MAWMNDLDLKNAIDMKLVKLREYSFSELSLLYGIDPFGVAYYVQEYTRLKYAGISDSDVRILRYKDDLFKCLFSVNPFYYERTSPEVWTRTYYSQARLSHMVSESELHFGGRRLTDAYTVAARNDFVIDLIGFVLNAATAGTSSHISNLLRAGKTVSQGWSNTQKFITVTENAFTVATVGMDIIQNGLLVGGRNLAYNTALGSMNIGWAGALLNVFFSLQEFANSLVGMDSSQRANRAIIYHQMNHQENFNVSVKSENDDFVPMSAIANTAIDRV